MEELSKRLKRAMINTILNKKQTDLDGSYMTTSQGTFSRNELASEIENETVVGVQLLSNIISLSIHLLEREKEKI
jgi:hypothetical protein